MVMVMVIIFLGIDQIMQTNNEKHKAKVQSVLLFTDGLATTGITDQSNILQQMKLRIQGIKNMAVKVPSRTEPAKSKHPLVEKSSSIRHKISQLIWHTKAKGTDKNEPGSEKKTGHGLASYRKCEEQHELLHDTSLRRSTELCVGYDTVSLKLFLYSVVHTNLPLVMYDLIYLLFSVIYIFDFLQS